MATVTKAFKENYDYWISAKIASGEFTKDDADELRVMIRKDLTPGPDQIRNGLELITKAGIEVPAMIDNCDERYSLWDSFFAAECAEMRCAVSGINARIRASIASEQIGRKAA